MYNTSENEDSLFNLRNLIFIIMTVTIGLTLYFGSASKTADQARLDTLVNKMSDFQMRVILAQVILKPEMDHKLHVEQVEFLFETLEGSQLINLDNLPAQKFMVLKYLGANPVIPESVPAAIKNDLRLLYSENKILNEESQLFKITFGDLARLHQYSIEGRTGDHDRLLGDLMEESKKILIKMQTIFFGTLTFFMAGIFVIYAFMKKQKISFFSPILELIPIGNQRLLLETVIIHLFIMFPVAAYIFISYPGLDPFLFNAVFIPAAFILSLTYYKINAGETGYLKELFLGISGSNILKEIYYGMVGFLGLFPIAMLSMFLGFGMFDNQGVRFAHPIVFAVKDHPAMIFFLAVIIAPITEEIIFRVFLYGFFRRYLRIHHAAIMTGMIFAALHPQGMNAFFYLIVVGGGLAIIREFRPGLIAPITTHVLINSIATLAAYQYMAD